MTQIQRVGLYYFTGSLVLLTLLFLLYYLQSLTIEGDQTGKRIEEAKNTASRIYDQAETLSNEKDPGFLSILEEMLRKGGSQNEELAFFITHFNEIIFWTTDKVPLDLQPGISQFPVFKTITLANGSYLITGKSYGEYTLICTILKQQSYPFENRYLKNSSRLDTWFSTTITIINLIIFFTFYIFVCVLFLKIVLLFYCQHPGSFRRLWCFLGFLAGFIIIRLLFIYFRLPVSVYEMELFNPATYSSGKLFPSLGDLLFHLIAVLIFILGVNSTGFTIQKNEAGYSGKPWLSIFFYFFSLLSLISLSLLLIRDLVVNSTVSFDLSDFEGITYISLLGISAILLILVIDLIIAVPIIQIITLNLNRHLLNRTKLFGIVSIFLVFFTSGIVFYSMIEKEMGVRRIMALKVINRQNPVNEEKIDWLRLQISRDSLVQRFFVAEGIELPALEAKLQRYLDEMFLHSFRAQYNAQITFCDEDRILTIQPKGDLVLCSEYFAGIIGASGSKTSVSGLWQMDYGVGPENYLLALLSDSTPQGILSGRMIVIELTSKFSLSNLGYPALLLNERQVNFPDVSGYSFAIYRDGNMVHSVGSASYPMLLSSVDSTGQDFCLYHKEGYSHLQITQEGGTRAIIISRKAPGFLNLISLFSYLLILLVFLFWIVDRASGLNYIRIQSQNSLKMRLQMTLTGALVATLLIVGSLAVYYITALNAKKNNNYLKEKSLSLLIELQHKLSSADSLSASGFELESLLIKFSNVFFTDVNLFDPAGRLIASSRSQIFEEGIISRYMNPIALRVLRSGESSLFIQKEHIGTQYFNSAYMPVYNNMDRLLGYMNLPYFSKQDELSKEISGFLNAFINLYFLIILAGIAISVLISRRITRPLEILAQRLSQVKLGQSSELLEWRQKDEIGHLVSEYNRMVTALAVSTQRLARSERESAWREMARQVAHEIKNPLTPMKLSIQHLKKAWDEKSPDWELRMERLTRSLVLQIDQLSSIASDFSDFAKMDEPVNVLVELDSLVRESLEIFHDFPGLQISFEFSKESISIYTDPRHVRRILTNLVNNSVQSSKPGEDCIIRITTEKDKNWAILEINDNGQGIPAELMDKVFQPYFTTRSGGTGLGLAIVKGLIQMMNGEIELFSNQGAGTIVRIKLPITEKDGDKD